MRLAPLLSLLCSLIVGLSAFLLFFIQPLAAKILLPLYGGASSVWITCSVFFQVALFIGYLIADLLIRRASASIQLLVYLLFLLLSALYFPLEALHGQGHSSLDSPSIEILCRLAVSLGVPFITLSMTASLGQYWFFLAGRSEPYRLYAVSNLASFVALLSFPIVLEPLFDVEVQAEMWSLMIGILVGITAIFTLFWRALSSTTPPPRPMAAKDDAGAEPEPLFWLSAAAFGVVILLAITNYLCADIAPIPLLWVVPLALYLATYIVSFSTLTALSGSALMVGCILALAAFCFGTHRAEPLLAIGGLLLTLFFGCSICHGELARARPGGHALSTYYRSIALGGALGGIFVGIIAPLLFERYFEVVIAFTAPVIVRIWALQRTRRSVSPAQVPLAILGILVICLTALDPLHTLMTGEATRLSRNFYGTLGVTDYHTVSPPYRELTHGSTVHGVQNLLPEHTTDPTMYYGKTSAIGLALASLPFRPRTIGVIGLGAGTLAAYARPGDVFHFIELNPEIIRIAREEFSFLERSHGQTFVHEGDGRLVLEKLTVPPLDLLLIDAFSGDAIPTHLISKEAIELYLQKSDGGGLLVFHISNRYLDLAPVLASAAESLGLHAALFHDSGEGSPLLAPSVYVVLARGDGFFNHPEIKKRLQTISGRTRVWTDRYSSLWSVFRAGL